MCGILGSVNIDFDEKVLASMAHRGPDDAGIAKFPVGTHTLTFGQRRLSILDLSQAGHQPMLSPCGGYALIFNGEIYNHMALREDLPKGHVFKGHSDTETVLACLMEHGASCIPDFNGIFAFAFLDLRKKRLLLARDPFGVKPLYYAQHENNLVFASEIRPIKALLGATKLDKDALASLLRLRYNAAPYTLHREIRKVKPGHLNEIDFNLSDVAMVEKDYAKALPTTRKENKDDLVRAYGTHLEKAVKRQLLSDVEVGILLSGGVDSAVIAALAKKHYPGLKAFTIGFEGDHVEDEIKDAAETAELLGLEHHVKRIDFKDFLNLIENCSRIVEEPLATTSIIPMYFLADLAAEHVKVVLTGQGADEPLGGYTRYKAEVLRTMLPSPLRSMAAPISRVVGRKSETIRRGGKSIGISNDIQRFLSVYEIFGQAEIAQLLGVRDGLSKHLIADFYKVMDCASQNHAAERMMALDTRMNLADDLLNYTDKITMNFSLECRVPMLDIPLVRYMESLPLSSRLSLKGGKLIHKEFAKRLLPDSIIQRKKKGFQSPTVKWFREEAATLKEILLAPGTPFSELFDQKYINTIIAKHSAGFNMEKQIFLLLGIYYWTAHNLT